MNPLLILVALLTVSIVAAAKCDTLPIPYGNVDDKLQNPAWFPPEDELQWLRRNLNPFGVNKSKGRKPDYRGPERPRKTPRWVRH